MGTIPKYVYWYMNKSTICCGVGYEWVYWTDSGHSPEQKRGEGHLHTDYIYSPTTPTAIRYTCIQAAVHCNEKPIYVFLFWELRGLRPNFHLHVSVIDLYISRIGPHISCSRIGR
jgi:hypothetical protein